MGDVFHRANKVLSQSVNTPDYASGTYAINPAGIAGLLAGGVRQKYWKLTGSHPSETVSEMDASEKAAEDDVPAILAVTKVTRIAQVDGVTQDIIDKGFLHDSKIFGLSTVDIDNLNQWREKVRAGTDTYAEKMVLLNGTTYSIADRASFLQIYHTCKEALEAARTGGLTLRSSLADAADDAAVDAITDSRTVEKYTPAGTPSRGPFALTGSQDLTAGTPVNLNITGADDIFRITRARFWISANSADVGANVVTRIALKFFGDDGFKHAELDTDGLGALLEDFGEFQFVSQDVKVAPNNGAGAVDIDDTTQFGIDDFVRIHDGTNYEFQRVDAVTDADTLSLYDTILKAGTPAWALDNDVTRVLEIRDLGYVDQDDTDEIHLRLIPRGGDSNCRLHYWIEYERAF